MKNYPKALAQITAIKETVEHLFNMAEHEEVEAADYREQVKAQLELTEERANADYYEQQVAKHDALADAYRALAEKLIGGVTK